MKRALTFVFALGLVLCLATAAAAEDKKKKKPGKAKGPDATALFGKLDANGDKKVSKDEFVAFKGVGKKADAGKEPKGLATARDEWFKKLDANGDASLTVAEFGKLKQVMAASPAKKKKVK
jgi:EF-hand domain pair